jgi:hypothetical protein
LNEALVISNGSVAASTRKLYNSIWKKWTVFMQTCHHNPSVDTIACKNINQQELLELLLMFVAYCVNVLKTTPTSIPGILSGLKNNLGNRLVVVDAFTHILLSNMKTAVARLPYTPRISLPCTYSMILHIIRKNTDSGFTKDQFMLANMRITFAFAFELRASEYASRTKVPDPESHQFDSKSVEFKCFGSTELIPSSRLHTIRWTNIEIIRFTIQHAKNIRKGYGVPIWFSTQEPNEDAVAFLQLVYLWAHMSQRLDDDPFLSYRSNGTLHCLVYTSVHSAIAQCAAEFGFNPKWFKPHGVRQSTQTILRAAGGDDGDILVYGRWKQVTTSLIYQGTSTKNNNRLLRTACNAKLFTDDDIRLSRLLPSSKGQNQHPTVRRF